MLQRIISKKVELPPIWLVEDKEDFDKLPKGIPYIIGNKSELSFITIFLEFQILLKSCEKTSLPIKWLDCLKRIGYGDKVRNYTLYSGGEYEASRTGNHKLEINDFVEDQYIVNFDRLSALKILPIWLDNIRSSVEANIINEVIFDPTAFNKQMGMNIGAGAITNHKKNLLILDVSGSIPRAVVMTITNLAKLMSKRFHADVMITSGQTVLIDYDNVPNSDIIAIARNSGTGNEGEMYKKIIEEYREYNTVIAFGDDDSPKAYQTKGDLKSNFKIETIYSLHTNDSSKNVVGYARYLKSTKDPILVKDWVTTINK